MRIAYLWTNRSQHAIGSPLWWRAMAKRALTLPTVVSVSARSIVLSIRGADCSPTAIFAGTVHGPGSNLHVGEQSFVGRAEISAHAHVHIGARVVINDGVVVLTASHDTQSPSWPSISAPVIIEDYAWIGFRAMILPGVRIGKGAVVGAGAIVRRDVAPFAIVVGNPAAPIKRSRPHDLAYDPTRGVAFVSAWLK